MTRGIFGEAENLRWGRECPARMECLLRQDQTRVAIDLNSEIHEIARKRQNNQLRRELDLLEE